LSARIQSSTSSASFMAPSPALRLGLKDPATDVLPSSEVSVQWQLGNQ
jgi:hypothetical protein